VIAGASNAGLIAHGVLTAYTLSQMTSLILPDPFCALDDLVLCQSLIQLWERAEPGIYDAQDQLEFEVRDAAP
jgi:hypothetical protein